MPKDNSIYGVGGWLGWFIFALVVLGPLLTLSSQQIHFTQSELQNPAIKLLDSWKDFKQIAWFTVFFFTGLRIYAGYLLLNKHEYSTVVTTKKILWITGPIASIFLNLIIIYLIFGSVELIEALPQIFKDTLGSLIWIWYLNKSVRVKNTYR